MIVLTSTEDVSLLAETEEVECKLATGRDGRGQIPIDFWPTYSAFANTHGGIVLLGLKESGKKYEVIGLPEPEKLCTDLFNLLNNLQKVSVNLLTRESVRIVTIAGQSIIQIEVPTAGRRHRPVHINGNPMTGTYFRLDEGDRVADPNAIKRMLAEQIEDSRDNRVLRGFDYSDLSNETILAYRQAMRDRTPNHPFLDVDDTEFLRKVGAMRRDRESGSDGLTLAGLLMFGTAENIRDEFPNYHLDYQERPRAQAEQRWIDRITLDGTWSGNLFDFYRRVYRKLVADLKVPFALEGAQRQDETPVHEALREAIVNAIVHADYTDRASVLVVKRPDMFGFRNPGRMRVPVAQAIAGGESDGRNRTLQSMFLLVGAGERAGSGVPKIHKGWKDQHWVPPALWDIEEPSQQTLLELRMSDLIPPESMDRLRKQFGSKLSSLIPDQRLVLATAATEGLVSHSRMLSICDLHPVDLSRMLQGLVQDGFLKQSGRTKATIYRLTGVTSHHADPLFPSSILRRDAGFSPKGSELGTKGSELDEQGSESKSEPLSIRVMGDLGHPIIYSIEHLDEVDRKAMESISKKVSVAGKTDQNVMKSVVLELCSERYLTLRVLATLLDRSEDYLRQRVLNSMVREGILGRAYPLAPNDPRQAYIAVRTRPFLVH